MSDHPTVAFYVRNAFQVSHLRPLYDAVPNAVWLLKSAKDRVQFGLSEVDRVVASRLFLRRKMERFDVVVSHASPPGGRPLDQGKFVMVQYGYAKEPYNFGAWRAQANAIMSYGPYATSRFAEHAPTFAIGNPRLDDWNSAGFREAARERVPLPNDGKPVILYAPTWGALSSLPEWSKALSDLAGEATVLVKAHHNSVRDGQTKGLIGDSVVDVSHIDLFQLLCVSDVVLSDYSGAIFDAIMCEVPVVLLDLPNVEERFGSKLDAESIEIKRRDALGYVIQRDDDLAAVISKAIQKGPRISDALKTELFISPDQRVADTFRSLLAKIMAL